MKERKKKKDGEGELKKITVEAVIRVLVKERKKKMVGKEERWK